MEPLYPQHREGDNSQPIQGINPDTGEAPRSRIRDAQAAYDLFNGIIDDDRIAAMYRTRIQGLIDGNPPYNPDELKRNGQSWRSNVNFREAEAIIETNSAAIWELDMEVPTLINVETDFVDPLRPGINYADIIEQEYTRTVLRWPDYFFNRMLCTKEMLITGIGPMAWYDKWDWRPHALKRGSLLIPTDSKAAIGELELIGIRHTYQAHELYQLIKDEESKQRAEEAGWNTELILELLVKSVRNEQSTATQSRYQTTIFEAVQQALKNNDIATAQITCNPIRVIQMLVKEYSGKVSRFMIYEDETIAHYIYEGLEEFDSMSEVICLFMWNIGDGYYRSVKGLGHRIFPHVELSNRFINTTVDGASMSSSFILQPQGAGNMGQVQLMRVGPITVLPAGYAAVQQSFAPNLSGMIEVRGMLYGILNNNTGVYKQEFQGEDQPRKSARQVNVEEMTTAKLEKNQISIHYLYLDQLHKEIFRRLTQSPYPAEAGGYDEAKQFRERLREKNVPDDVLKDCVITAKRAIGYGSMVMRDMITDKVLALANAGMDEIGRRNAVRDKLASLVGYNMVDRYMPESGRDQVPTSETSLATIENSVIMNGQQVVVGVDQPHMIHWGVHYPFMMRIASAFVNQPQSIDLQRIVPAFAIGLDHLTKTVQGLAQDKTREVEVKRMNEALKPLIKVFNEMQSQLDKQMQAQQQAQQQQQQQVQQAQQVLQSQDAQLALEKIHEETAVKRENMLLQNQLREEKAKHAMALKDLTTSAAIQRKNQEVAAAPVQM